MRDFKTEKARFESDFIRGALTENKGMVNKTALNANIPKKTLLRKMKLYGIRAEDFREFKKI